MRMKVERVTVSRCSDTNCNEYNGPDGHHVHFFSYIDGREKPVESPAFSSRKGAEMWLSDIVPDEAKASEDDKCFLSLARAAVNAANLPETSEGEEEFIKMVKEDARKLLAKSVIIIGDSAVFANLFGESHHHSRFERIVGHGKYVIVLKGCEKCKASLMEIWINDQLWGSSDVSTLRHVSMVLDLVAEESKMSKEDVAALRKKLPELFPAKGEAAPVASDQK